MEEVKPVKPVGVKASRGLSWVGEGFSFFRSDWLSWVGLAILLIVLSMVSTVIPVANILVPVITPIIFAGLMLACQQQDQGGEIGVSVIFSGFSSKPLQLALIGLAYLLANIAILTLVVILLIIIVGGVEAVSQISIEEPDLLIKHSINLLLAALIGLSLYIPVLMAMWFAPALVVFHDISAARAMLLSIKACLLNVLPFLIYGVVTMVLMIIASIPLMLGWLVLLPVLVASIYVSYRDIFGGSQARIDSPGSLTP